MAVVRRIVTGGASIGSRLSTSQLFAHLRWHVGSQSTVTFVLFAPPKGRVAYRVRTKTDLLGYHPFFYEAEWSHLIWEVNTPHMESTQQLRGWKSRKPTLKSACLRGKSIKSSPQWRFSRFVSFEGKARGVAGFSNENRSRYRST